VRFGFWFSFGLSVFCGLALGGQDREMPHASCVVAVVNGTPITFGEVWERIHRKLEEARSALPEPRFQVYARRLLLLTLQDYISRHLILRKAKEEGLTVTDKQIERYAEREMAYFNDQGENLVTLEDYWEVVRQQTGMSEREYREELKAKVIVTSYMRRFVWEPEYFSPEVVRAYYLEHRDQFRTGGYITIRHVYIQRELPEFERITERIRAAIEKGEFDRAAREAVARGYSHRAGRDGAGLYRYSLEEGEGEGEPQEGVDGTLNDLWEPLRRAILSLKPGEVSRPIQSAAGVHFIKVVARGGGRVKRFSEVQLQIQRALSWDLEEKTKREYLRKLVAQAEIKRFPFPERTPLGVIPWGSGAGPAGFPLLEPPSS